ncbi:hypothetical protein [Lichenibacterium ramalinae]|nr:hypothetical protein [Lichenibacterium ramalinae]
MVERLFGAFLRDLKPVWLFDASCDPTRVIVGMPKLHMNFDVKVKDSKLAAIIHSALLFEDPKAYLDAACQTFHRLEWLREGSIMRHVGNLYRLREIEMVMAFQRDLATCP